MRSLSASAAAARALTLASLGALLAAAGCAMSPAAGTPGASTRAEPITDANIAAIVVEANKADISYAQLAMARGGSEAVKQFAQTMITDHTAVNQQAVALVTKLGVTPVDHTVSLDMRDNAEEIRDKLRELTGAAFDREYALNEVSYHEKLLAAIDTALIPSAKNAELKALLEAVRPAVAHHLEMARTLRTSVGG